MDIAGLKHNPEAVHRAWYADANTQTIVATEDCKIYFPKSWLSGKLGTIDSRFNVLGVFAIVVGNNYAVSDCMAKMPLIPDEVNAVKINEIDYYELSWLKGSVICPNRFLVKDKQLLYHVFEEFHGRGRQPWYIGVVKLISLFHTSVLHGGASLNTNQAIISLLTSARARQEDRTKYFKEQLITQSDLTRHSPVMIPLANVAYGSTNATARLYGGYLTEGLVSELVNPSERQEKIESLLTA